MIGSRRQWLLMGMLLQMAWMPCSCPHVHVCRRYDVAQ